MLFVAAAIMLLIEIYLVLPHAITWTPDDYAYFLRWGSDARNGVLSYRYPLPTLLWVFVPLSLLPNWFALVWVIAPFAFVLVLLGRKGVALWLSYPFLVHSALGQLDGWLMLPVYWLVEDHPALAGVSAALLSLKPQLALFPVPFMLYRWLRQRNWHSLLTFGGAMVVLYVPAFLLDPVWPLKMIVEDHIRATEPIQTTRGASLWAWWWRGGWAALALPLLLLAIALLMHRAFRSEAMQARSVYTLGLLSVPVLYALSFVTAIPILKNSLRAILLFTIVSWVCVAIDTVAGGWGGAYALIPVAVLALFAFENKLTPPIPTSQTAH